MSLATSHLVRHAVSAPRRNLALMYACRLHRWFYDRRALREGRGRVGRGPAHQQPRLLGDSRARRDGPWAEQA